MLSWILLFLILMIISGDLGFSGLAAAFAGIAKILFFVFLVLFAVALIFGRRRPASPADTLGA
jgi:uncharacterized membrane protein YtjA (UPF0391 family)